MTIYKQGVAEVAAGVPSGLIVMWHGIIANIPSGYVICDGNNSTPNLLTRFVQGVATAGTNPGVTGGATSKVTAGHTHTVDVWASNKTGTILSDGTNDHVFLLDSGSVTDWELTELRTSVSKGKRETTASQTDSISDIRPKYYDIAFLMKT